MGMRQQILLIKECTRIAFDKETELLFYKEMYKIFFLIRDCTRASFNERIRSIMKCRRVAFETEMYKISLG
jgi:hypothetical protein